MGRINLFRWPYVGAAALFAASLACFVSFLRLPGRSGRFYPIAVDDLRAPPDAGVGPLHWDYDIYAKDPALEPLRAFYRRTCDGRVALDAVVCLSDRLADAFPHGSPAKDLFDPTYDPVQDLTEHLAGVSGHCVTRSGALSATLLSVAIPARVVQVWVTPDLGHNAVEVWDAKTNDWVFFDPTYGVAFVGEKGGARPVAVGMFGLEPGRWTQSGKQPVANYDRYYGLLTTPAGRPAVRLPEPWLYTRLGSRTASWPYRAAFVHAGDQRWENGRGQETLRPLAVIFIFAGLAFVAYGRLARRRLRDDAHVAEHQDTASLAESNRA